MKRGLMSMFEFIILLTGGLIEEDIIDDRRV